ncbi:MAG: TolC family protein [Bacteroidales bacterium]|nr:TolC family protein [Bacteroidales bacterium]
MKKIVIAAFLIFNYQLLIFNSLQAQTLTLDSCLVLAQRNNADILISRLDVEKAQAVKNQALTNFFPKIKLGALGYVAARPMISFGLEDVQSNDMRDLLTAIYEVFSKETDVTDRLELMKKGYSASVVATQPVFAGGRIVNGNRLASLGETAAELKAQVAMRDVLENVESTFYLVVGLQEKEATVNVALSLIDSLDKVVSSALANGLVTRSDALQIELKRNEINAMRQQLKSGIRLSRRLLCNQIGIEYSDNLNFVQVESVTSPLPVFSNTETGDYIRPEKRLLQINIESQELFKKMTIGETLPQLAILGIGYYGNAVRNYATANAVVGFSLSIPLTDWWETSHKIREHDIRIEQARAMQKNYGEKMSLEEEKAYSDMLDAWMLIKSDSAALGIARENYRLANINYAAGNVTISEVLQAHTLLLQAENAITDRRVSYLVARRRLSDLRSQR